MEIDGKKRGRILRVKKGFNPNSSSIGSVIFALPTSLMAVTIGFSIVSAVLLPYFLGKPGPQNPEAQQDSTDEVKKN